MSTPLNIDTVITYTGKLNKTEKAIATNGLTNHNTLGNIINDIALSRSNITILDKMQDQKNSKIKNPCSSKVQLDLKVDSQTNQLNHWEQRQQEIDKVRNKTNEFINLQKSKRTKKPK